MVLSVPRMLIAAAALAVISMPALAQRPALAGEKAQVADAVKADLARLHDLQETHHSRARVYAADARDLNFTPTSGAQINIAYASANAWAANATHPVLSPIACFIIISSAEPTGPAAEPFCQEGRPGSTTPTVAASPPAAAPRQGTAGGAATPAQTPATGGAATPARTPATGGAAVAPSQASSTARPASGSTSPVAAPAPAATEGAPPPASRPEQQMSPALPAQPLRQPAGTGVAAAAGPDQTGAGGRTGGFDPVVTDRGGTREVDVSGVNASQQAETVTAHQFSSRLGDFATAATELLTTLPAEIARIVRDPYESTAEYEARRAAAVAAAERREREFFQQNSKTYEVTLPVREVRYDADREVLEFSVDGIGLPVTRDAADAAAEPTLTLTCYTRPVFWCNADTGMTYDAGDLWRVPRSTARQFDVLRTPLTLHARFAVGRREETQTLAVSLLAMDLRARGQSVQRWEGGSR